MTTTTQQTTRVLQSETVAGLDNDGVTVSLEELQGWTEYSDDHLYVVVSTDDQGQATEVFGTDDRDEAEVAFADVVAEHRADYQDALEAQRDDRKTALLDVTMEWVESDDLTAVETIAVLIGDGRAAEVVAALRAAGLIA